MLLIYSPESTNRLEYIFELIFKDILGVDMQITASRESYLDYKGPRICYGKITLREEVNIKCVASF